MKRLNDDNINGFTQQKTKVGDIDAAGLLEVLGIQRADVLGWSMGSYIDQELTLMYPNRVNNLILMVLVPVETKLFLPVHN
jgi:pimeloyl-ACP methyl ester carboxylesterase